MSIAVFSSILSCQQLPVIRSIEFSGNKFFSNDQIKSALLFNNGSMYSDSLMSSDINRILELYRNNAFFQANVDSVGIKRDSARNSVDICLFLKEGKMSILRNIEIEGSRHLSTDSIHAVMR